MTWRGCGPYQGIRPGSAGGGGFVNSLAGRGQQTLAIGPGRAGGGGRVQSTGAPVSGWSGGGNTGPSTGVRR